MYTINGLSCVPVAQNTLHFLMQKKSRHVPLLSPASKYSFVFSAITCREAEEEGCGTCFEHRVCNKPGCKSVNFCVQKSKLIQCWCVEVSNHCGSVLRTFQ